MSKLDFSRQTIPIGEPNGEIHDVIGNLRTTSNLSNLTNDFMNNDRLQENCESDRGFSPSLIDFEEGKIRPSNLGMYERLNTDLACHRNIKEKPYPFDSFLDISSSSSSLPATTTSNSLRRWYRRAQDVSLAAIPNLDWEEPPSPTYATLSPTTTTSDNQFVSQLHETKNQNQQQPLSVFRQLTTLKTPTKRYHDHSDINCASPPQNFSSSKNWNDDRRRYFSHDSQTEAYNSSLHPLTENSTLSQSVSTSFNSPLNLKKANGEDDANQQFVPPTVDLEEANYGATCSQFISEQNYFDGASTSTYFSAGTSSSTSPQDVNIFVPVASLQSNGKVVYRKKVFSPFVPVSSVVPFLSDSKTTEIKVELEPSYQVAQDQRIYKNSDEVEKLHLLEYFVLLLQNQQRLYS